MTSSMAFYWVLFLSVTVALSETLNQEEATLRYERALPPADVKENVMESLKIVPLNKAPEKVQNGKDFYQYFFSHHPEHRKYFKGAESSTADDVQIIGRSQQLRTALMMSLLGAAMTNSNKDVFLALYREAIDRHVNGGFDPVLWKRKLTPADVKKNVMESLKTVPLGKTPEKVQNGKDFYKYLFSHHPEQRKYFKGAENFTADDVQASERFERLGSALQLSVHLLANTYDNEDVFRAFCRDAIDRHVNEGLDPVLWKDFWSIYVAFLESRGTTLSAEQKQAWEQLGTLFNEEYQLQLAKRGLPHV